MKKQILIFSLAILLVLYVSIIKYFNLTKYGKFYNVGTLNYIHYDSDAIKLSNGNILVLGNYFNNIPSEIYNPNSNEVSVYNFPNNLKVYKQAIALPNNKIMLIKSCDTLKSECKTVRDFSHNIIVYDIVSKQYNVIYQTDKNINLFIHDYFTLENNNVAIFLEKLQPMKESHYIVVIYNTQSNLVEISDVNKRSYTPKGISINTNELLVLEDNSYLKKYNINNRIMQETGTKITMLEPLSYVKLKNKIFIFGTNQKGNYGHLHLHNELYDLEENSISKISKMNDVRTANGYNTINKAQFNSICLDDKHILITGGIKYPKGILGFLYPNGKVLKTAEIYDIERNKFMKIKNMNYEHSSHNVIKTNTGLVIIGGKTQQVEVFK